MKNIKNQQGGFLELILVIIIVLVLMRYFGFTITGFLNWLETLFYSVW
ncbi:MAG: hypothetical protein NTW98_00395 [Candidatus Nomurabacteria bacterium]|nr:hypothetical protein [Candidatus Nomurabacteria bacterium]